MTDITKASRILADAFKQNILIDPLPADASPVDFDTAYEIQQATLALTGAKQTGWKLSVATRAAQAGLGIEGPLVGPLLDGRIIENGATITTNDVHFPNIEAEIAVVMASTPDGNATIDTVLDHIKSVHLAIEIADRRYRDRQGPVATLADLNSTGYLVLGPEITNWRDMAFLNVPVETKSDDKVLAQNSDPAAWPDPFGGLAYLVHFLAARGEELKPGAVVTTGACAVPTLTSHGRIEAIFDGIGTAHSTIKAG